MKKRNEIRISYWLFGQYHELHLVYKKGCWYYETPSFRKVKPLRKRKKHEEGRILLQAL